MRTKRLFEDISKIEPIILKCSSCFVGMVDKNSRPYVVPFNFGYHDGCIYLHSAQHGRKIEIMRNNPEVCVVFSTDTEIRYQNAEVACSYLMKYRSVQVFGKVIFLDTPEEKASGLNHIMKQYTGKEFKYGLPSLNEVAVYKVIIDKAFGKEFGY